MTNEEKISLIDDIEETNILSESHFQFLKSLSNDTDSFVRSQCASVLVNFKRDNSLDLLFKLSEDDDSFVRTEAYDSLGVFVEKAVEKRLFVALNAEKDALARRYAILSWGGIVSQLNRKFDDEIVFILRQLETEKDESCILEYWYVLHLLGYKESVTKIINFLKNSDYRIRCSAIKSLSYALTCENELQIKSAVKKLTEIEKTVAVKSSAIEFLEFLESR